MRVFYWVAWYILGVGETKISDAGSCRGCGNKELRLAGYRGEYEWWVCSNRWRIAHLRYRGAEGKRV